jgi:hypothetical protein
MTNLWDSLVESIRILISLSAIIHSNYTNSSDSDLTDARNTSNRINRCIMPGYTGSRCELECGVTFFNQNQKIVGGQPANAHAWPSTVYIGLLSIFQIII